jgi:hypothetical protein
MLDIESHILRIENKIGRTKGPVWVYKDGDRFRSSSNYLEGYDKRLVGVYDQSLDSYMPGMVEEDIRWAAREMK